jgi:hypothetical protein
MRCCQLGGVPLGLTMMHRVCTKGGTEGGRGMSEYARWRQWIYRLLILSKQSAEVRNAA